MPNRDIKILGAGPSGLTAAINLANAGYNVRVFDLNKTAGARFGEDFQGLENWSQSEDALDLLESYGLKNDFYTKPFYKSTFTNAKKSVELVTKKPLFYLVKRGTTPDALDQRMLEQAKSSGVKFHFGETIPEGKADIIATGPKAGGTHTMMAIGKVFETGHKDISLTLINNKTSYLAYSYLLVADGHGCIATMLFGSFKNAGKYLEQSIRAFEEITDFTCENPRKFGGVGNYALYPNFQRGKSLIVGEAAGLQDFLAGFGMKTAIKSGYLAAESIIQGQDYQKIAESTFEDYLKSGIVNRYLFEKDVRYNHKIFLSGIRRPDFLDILKSLYNFNSYQKKLYPIAYRYINKKYPEAVAKTTKTVHI